MLFAAAQQLPVAGRHRIELPARDVAKPERSVALELRHGEVEIPPAER